MIKIGDSMDSSDIGKQTYSIGELAEEFGITARTLRVYEEEGLLDPERDGTRRIYNERNRVRLRLILRGKRLGWSLSEIRESFELYDSNLGEEAPRVDAGQAGKSTRDPDRAA